MKYKKNPLKKKGLIMPKKQRKIIKKGKQSNFAKLSIFQP